jgi:Phosphoribosyl transferase (PRTase)/PELOTA RNA binding domain
MNKPFSGSYRPEDVTFLLKRIDMAPTDVAEKEHAIQSGRRHYSEMLSIEKTPDQRYMKLFNRALRDNQVVFARHVASLARSLACRPGKEVVLVSLARAGTPVGVLLHRGLEHLGRASVHYSISIIRDRGIDAVALDYILERHADADVVFIDGWTGKGAISSELHKSVTEYNQSRGVNIDPALVVVADLAGVAALAATSDDYLIPSSILNAIISGLVSRTVLNDEYVGEGDFHACVFYEEKRAEDLSCLFVDVIGALVCEALDNPEHSPLCSWNETTRSALKQVSDAFVADAMERYAVTDRNRIKPGVGESTRALLRRVPDRLIVRQLDLPEVQHLCELAKKQNVVVEVEPAMPYKAAVIIKTLGD